MAEISSYKDLVMWRKAKDLAVEIYRTTSSFPKDEIYGITSQLRRAAVSMPSNIAEGFSRRFSKEKIQFLRIAHGSGAEISTQLIISAEMGYISSEKRDKLLADVDEVMRIINVVIRKL